MTIDLVGRDVELGVLRARLSVAEAGTPQVVLIEGAAGIGKSALVSSFVNSMPAAASLITASCDDAESGRPFALLDQFYIVARTRPPSAEAETSLHGADPLAVGAELLQILSRFQDGGTAVVIIDDAHLMDSASARAITFALRRLRADRLLAVLTARSSEVERLPVGLQHLVSDHGLRMSLGGLSTPDVALLATAVCGRPISRGVAARLRSHTDGNPLHLRGLLLALSVEELEDSQISLPAPPSIAALCLGRLAATSSDAQDLAAAAAVLGDRATQTELAKVAEVIDPLPGLEELQQAGILRLSGRGSEWRSQFSHVLMRVAIYDQLGPATRRLLHSRACDVLTGPIVLGHRVAASTGPDEELASRLEKWARQQQMAGSFREAADSMLSARRLSLQPAEADRRLLDAVELMLLSGDVAMALSFAERLSSLPRSARRIEVQARTAWLTGNLIEAERLGREALPLAKSSGAVYARVTAMLSQMSIFADEGWAAHNWAQASLSAEDLPSAQTGWARAMSAQGLAISGHVTDGLRLLGGSPDQPRPSELLSVEELSTRGWLRLLADDLNGALVDLRAAGVLGQPDPGPYRLVAMCALAETHYRLGNWDDSLAIAESALSLGRDTEQSWLLSLANAMSVLVLAARGRWVDAEQRVEAARDAASQVGGKASEAYAANAAVHLAMCRDDPKLVLCEAAPVLAQGPLGGAHEPGVMAWPVHYSSALVAAGGLDDAQRALEGFESTARARSHVSRIGALSRVRGQLAAARRQNGPARVAFENAIELEDGRFDALEGATAHAAFGRFLRRRGERRAAADQLEIAHERFLWLGARPFAERCQAELAACGKSPGAAPTPLSARWDLTPQEQAVATLACAGLSNRKIAEELVLSVKTISYHLEHVYAKVGVHSRAQLVAIMSRP